MGAGAALIDWKELIAIAQMVGEKPPVFEHTQLYTIVEDKQGKIQMRTAPASKTPGDIKVETLYVPKSLPLSREAEAASYRKLGNMLKDLGITDIADSMKFNDRIRSELEGTVPVLDKAAKK